jgi:DNA adenine methylase
MNLSTLSPLRYPGGKSWLTPTIRTWLSSHTRISTFVEPFAGGANVGLFVLANGLADRLVLVEKDKDVLDIWHSVLNEPNALSSKIMSFTPDQLNLERILTSTPTNRVDRAFKTLLRNRVARGGVLSESGGMLRRGENDLGVFSRWYPATLIHRIQCIAALSEQIELRAGDGLATLSEMAMSSNVAFLIDPPYSGIGKAAGNRLYSCWEIDHWKLFELCEVLKSPFLLTYEDTIEVEMLAMAHSFNSGRIPMRNSHNTEIFELLISKDLDWMK